MWAEGFDTRKIVPAGQCPTCGTQFDWMRVSWGRSLKWVAAGLIIFLFSIRLLNGINGLSIILGSPRVLSVILAIALFIFMGFGFTGRQLVVAPATEPPRQGWIAILVVFLTIPALFYIWVLYSALYGSGGSSPNQQVLGKVLFVEQLEEQQSCTGIVATPQGVWLVGRSSEYSSRPRDVLSLESLLPGNLNEEPKTGLIIPKFGGFGGQKVSLISRLGEDGVFHVVASVSGYACLFASADGAYVLVLTEVELPEPTKGEKRPYQEKKAIYREDRLAKYYQTAVFRTDDQGETWRLLLEEGFMAKADYFAWGLKPYFYGSHEVWAWTDPFRDKDYAQLFYSPDQGATVEAIESSKDLFKDLSFQHVKVHVVQLDAQQARVWVSGYRNDSEGKTITHEAKLTRKKGPWELGEIRSTEGLSIHHVKENGSGRIIAALSRAGEPNVLAELAADGYSWTPFSLLPHPFTPLDGSSYAENLFASEDVIVLVAYSHYYPLGLRDGISANVNSVYFSNDGGKSWSRLAIPDPRGLLGFDARKKQVYWKKGGSRYDKFPDLNIYSYDLSQ